MGRIIKQQLFLSASYDVKKRIYYVDRPGNEIAEVHVDQNDNIIKTKGFGYQATVLKNNAFKGKQFVQEYYRSKNEVLFDEIIKKGSSALLPMVIQKQLSKVSFIVFKKNISFLDKAIQNYRKGGYEVIECSDRLYVYGQY